MKLGRKLLVVAAVAAAGLTTAIIPMTSSNAATACAPAWSSTAIYVKDNTASQNGHNYTAKWWTQNESPATHSGQWDVWADNGACGGGTTTPPTTGPTTSPPTTGTKMASAPYVYPGWGNPPAPSTVTSATGIKAFTMAFVLASGGCNPAWDGEGGLTGGPHQVTINAIRAAGGDVIPSFGGFNGSKLGEQCATPQALAAAYMQVVNQFNLRAIDIDIEANEFDNDASRNRVIDALRIVKQQRPSLITIITFGILQSGPNFAGSQLIQRAAQVQAGIDIFTIMPFDFGAGNGDMFAATVSAATGTKNALRSAFGWDDATAWRHLGISGMNGLSDQSELTTLQRWTQVRDFANQNHLGRLSFWGVNRDRACPGQAVSSSCSSIAQSDWDFTRVTAGFRP